MPTPVCPICRSERHRKCFDIERWHLLCCAECGLFHVDPYPATDAAAHDRVREADDHTDGMPPQRQRLYDVQFYKQHFDFIDRHCRTATSVLDVGCGTGRLIELLGKYPDMKRMGIELNPRRAKYAADATGCEIHQVPVERFGAAGPFDAITMINVLSHIRSFDELFGALGRLLTDGGKLIVKTGELRADVRRVDVGDWGMGEHFHFQGMGTMDHLCRRFGFELVAHQRIPHSRELYSHESFHTPGSTPARRIIKRIVSRTPLALRVLAMLHDIRHGRRVFSSFFVLKRKS